MILKAGVQEYYVVDSLKLNGIKDPTTMLSGQARQLMGLIKNGSFKKPEQPVVDPEPVQDPEDEVIADSDVPATPEVEEFETPPLVVDDDLKEYVSTKFDRIGLSSWGKRWLFTKICGKPLSDWNKLIDNDWRKAYDMWMAIEAGTFVIPAEYHPKGEPKPRDFSEPTNDPLEIVQTVIPGATLDED
jgi:hypothetical protein